MTDTRPLDLVAGYAPAYLASLDDHRVGESATLEELRAVLGGSLPEQPTDPETVVAELIQAAESGVVRMGSGRYDSGLAFCRHPDSHRAAMTVTASYLIQAEEGGPRDDVDWTPGSRAARGASPSMRRCAHSAARA